MRYEEGFGTATATEKREAVTAKRKLFVLNDESPEDPHEWAGQWLLKQFNSRKYHYADVNDMSYVDDDGMLRWNEDIAAKMRVGLAFEVSYFEHGQCRWGVKGMLAGMPDAMWDGVAVAGVLVWGHNENDMGAKTVEDRKKEAEQFLETYTAWCNGDVYGYRIEDGDGEMLDSCYGYYGYADMEVQVAALRDEYPNLEAGDRDAKSWL